MKTSPAAKSSKPQLNAALGPNHPLIGTWEEVPNHYSTGIVEIRVSVRLGKFSVSAEDLEDKIALKISNLRWDGASLYFDSRYPPTKHEAKNILTPAPKGRLIYDVSYTDAGGPFSERQLWRKVRPKKKK